MESLRTSKHLKLLNLHNRKFKFEFFKYMNDIPAQFEKLPVSNAFAKDITSLQALEDALRVRAAYAIYNSVVKGIAKDRENIKSKILMNEMYQID